jgi:hypothetical protein
LRIAELTVSISMPFYRRISAAEFGAVDAAFCVFRRFPPRRRAIMSLSSVWRLVKKGNLLVSCRHIITNTMAVPVTDCGRILML